MCDSAQNVISNYFCSIITELALGIAPWYWLKVP